MAKILLVDDDALNRDMLSRRLTKRKHEVLFAVEGGEVLDKARLERPDLILMDLSLPDISGLDVTRLIRADESVRSIPVIALTAHAMAGDQQRALAAGCDDYDTKPVDITRLMGKIEALLAKTDVHDG